LRSKISNFLYQHFNIYLIK